MVMDENEFHAERNIQSRFEVTRRPVIETGTNALPLTALPIHA
jgi:hypothetical protein